MYITATNEDPENTDAAPEDLQANYTALQKRMYVQTQRFLQDVF